jgi:hypothetical protein
VKLFIDDVQVQGASQYVANPDTSVPTNQSWPYYTSPVLPYGSHTVRIASDPTNPGYLVFDGVQISRNVVDTDYAAFVDQAGPRAPDQGWQ